MYQAVVSLQNVTQSPYVPMSKKSVTSLIKRALKYVVNFLIAYWVYKNSLKMVLRVQCAKDSDVIPFYTLTGITRDWHVRYWERIFLVEWLLGCSVYVIRCVSDWLIYTPVAMVTGCPGNDRAWFKRDSRVWFVCFVWLPCFTGVAREYYGGRSYDFTWLVVI